MNYKPFNVNNKVKIKLTDEGLSQHRAYVTLGLKDYKAPEVDKDGYSEFQLWELMHIFGLGSSMGKPVPFETEILIAQ